MWTRTFDEATTFVLTAQGTTDANKSLNLRLEDIDADLTTDPTNPAMSAPAPMFSRSPHATNTNPRWLTQRTPSKLNNWTKFRSWLQVHPDWAVPGDSSVFSISVRNTGNSAQYRLECNSEQRWQVMLGTSNSSQIDFEPLNILEYLPMTIRVFVPWWPTVCRPQGIPIPSRAVTSFTDASMNFTESVVITVLAGIL